MKPWRGKEFEYLGCRIVRKGDYIYAYDKNGNQISKEWNINHGSITQTKKNVERYLKRYNIVS